MASAICCLVPIVLSVLLLSCEAQETVYPFEYIYQLGDSLSDTGNLIRQCTAGETMAAAHLPYGESFPGRPTGRWSDGLLIIDFIAMALSLPLLHPYLDSNGTFRHGANFAVAGSTTLDYSFLSTWGIYNPMTNNSLGDQLIWFKSHLNTNCHSLAECSKMFTRALVFVGEIGGNDINYSLQDGKSIQEVYSYLPYMVEVISNVVREVIHLGAVNIVVPGNIPMGCLPTLLTKFSCGDPIAYDDMGCLRDINELVLAQNDFLQEALALLRLEFPHVVIIYADYYTTYQTILHRAPDFGFDEQSLLKACCGIGGVYNYNEEKTCGLHGVPVCHNPARYISWDGIHLTQEAYRHITNILMHDMLPRTMGGPITMEAF